MKIITSLDNSLIKKIRSLSVKKYREQFALCSIEGEKVVKEALTEPNLVEHLIIRQDKETEFEGLIKNHSDKVILVSQEVFKSLTHAVTPQSIMAVINIKKPAPLNLKENLIVLDNLQDPGNLGTIIRSGVASGHTNFVLINSVDPYNDKTLRSVTGTIFKANFYEVSLDEFISLATKNDINLLIADMDGQNIFESSDSIKKPYALVIGSEGKGVSSELRGLKHTAISIPMQNEVESLNAGVSAGIIMFNLTNN